MVHEHAIPLSIVSIHQIQVFEERLRERAKDPCRVATRHQGLIEVEKVDGVLPGDEFELP